MALNLVSAITLTTFAIHTGSTPAELGFDRTDLGQGLRTGSIAALCCSTGIGIAAALPPTRRFFLDARLKGMSRKEVLYQAGLRIPVATALTEEIMFRSVLQALFARNHSLRTTLTWTSFIFGLWHILPTLDTFEGNPASKLIQSPGRCSSDGCARSHHDDDWCRALLLSLKIAFEECGGPRPHARCNQHRCVGGG